MGVLRRKFVETVLRYLTHFQKGRRWFRSDEKKNPEDKITAPKEHDSERSGATGEGIGVQSRVPRVMNHAFSSRRNELERSAVPRSDRQINNVICSLGSRPIRNSPKDFVGLAQKDESRSCTRTKTLRERTQVTFSPIYVSLSRSPGSVFSLRFLPTLFLVTVFHSPPLFYDNRSCQRQKKLSQPTIMFEQERGNEGWANGVQTTIQLSFVRSVNNFRLPFVRSVFVLTTLGQYFRVLIGGMDCLYVNRSG